MWFSQTVLNVGTTHDFSLQIQKRGGYKFVLHFDISKLPFKNLHRFFLLSSIYRVGGKNKPEMITQLCFLVTKIRFYDFYISRITRGVVSSRGGGGNYLVFTREKNVFFQFSQWTVLMTWCLHWQANSMVYIRGDTYWVTHK